MTKKIDPQPHCYVIAGPNGAGKTSFATEFLPLYVKCLEFVNADLIAEGLSPFAPEAASVEAGRLVLERIHALAADRKDFAFETTLVLRSYVPFLHAIRDAGYVIHILYLWIPSAEMALRRIAGCVRQGGHDVPGTDVIRRFARSLRNLFTLYRDIAHSLYFFDNSGRAPSLIFKQEGGRLCVRREDLYRRITSEIP